ncbi:DUF4190 domain-containing protein [Agromyces humi]|uniref:DUF4190 domain-containing protein n=1 Tax=Agromyces humi TaxID=1766800 RepID=UPI00135901C0|nr:DUF4190 domain-containing protein [Agromyces humi]
MSDREGVPPEGGALSRSPGPTPVPEDPVSSPAAPASASASAAAGDGAQPVADDALTIVPPAEPTLRADPAVREYEVPFDTGELRSLPTGQLLVVHRAELARVADAEEDEEQRRVYSWISAILGVIGAAASLFLGWLLPLSIAAIVFGVLGLRREEEGRTLAFVGIGTGIAGLVFSSVWIGYYAIVFGALPR